MRPSSRKNKPRLISESWRGLLKSTTGHRTNTFHHRNCVARDKTMFGTEAKSPIVMCPGCDQPMKAMERKPVGFSNGLVDVTYVCEACLTHTIRTIKPDDKVLF